MVRRILEGHSGASGILYRENWRVCTLCAHGKNEHRHARNLHRLLSLATPLYILPYISGGLLRRSLSRLDSSGAFPSPLLLPWPPFHPSYKTDSLAGSQQYFSNSLISTSSVLSLGLPAPDLSCFSLTLVFATFLLLLPRLSR